MKLTSFSIYRSIHVIIKSIKVNILLNIYMQIAERLFKSMQILLMRFIDEKIVNSVTTSKLVAACSKWYLHVRYNISG